MNRRVVLGIVVTLLAVGALAAVGVYAYNWGLAQGAMQNAQIVVPGANPGEGVAPVYPFYGAPFYHYGPGFGRWGMGFGPLGCLVPILGFLLLFLLLRGLFGGWGGGWRRHGWGGPQHFGPGERGVPPMFEEWHRRAHEGGQPARSE
jgi:hypothetical protein